MIPVFFFKLHLENVSNFLRIIGSIQTISGEFCTVGGYLYRRREELPSPLLKFPNMTPGGNEPGTLEVIGARCSTAPIRLTRDSNLHQVTFYTTKPLFYIPNFLQNRC